jgi:DNA-binding NarL/FixJ family response regulator
MGRAKSNDEPAERNDSVSTSVADPETARIIARSFAVIALRLAPKKFANDSERIPFLKALGLSNSEIAKLLGTTANTVAVRLSAGGKAKKKKGKKSRAKN